MQQSSISAKDFQQIKQLGSGSFGKVTLVQDKTDQKLYAIKSVQLSKLNPKEKDNALNQVRLLASIRMPYVIGYKGAFFNDKTQSLCVVMQYADGGDLQNKINERINKFDEVSFEENYIWKVAYELLNALKKLHEHKIIHRDIKSANVFFANGIAKLGDLNVSKVSQLGYCQTHTGTPYYTSPQIWNGQKYTSKCDIWSLGCLIYEMCELKPPFRARDFPSLFRKVIVGQYEQISKKYSQQLKTFIRQCLTVDDKRRSSASELLDGPILSGMQLSLETFRNEDDDQIDLIDPIKCPRVLKFLNNRLPKHKIQSKKNVGFVTKKQIQKQDNGFNDNVKKNRKILSEKVIKFDFETNDNKSNKGSKKNIKLPPLDKQNNSEPLAFTNKKLKIHGTKTKFYEKQGSMKLLL